MRDVIHAYKYQGLATAARPLGHLLARAIAQLVPDAPLELLVVPVPLHRAKLAHRGFNQARLLAEQAIRALRRTHPGWGLTLASDTVVRLRATDSQAGLSPRQRRINLRGAFSVRDPRAVAGRHILLIDDIFTTGATARAVARELARAGAASIRVATLARAHLLFAKPHPQPAPAVQPASGAVFNQPSPTMLASGLTTGHVFGHQPSFSRGREDVAG